MQDFAGGASEWSLDAINVTDLNSGRTIGYDGSGVYVAVVDTGLVGKWREYLPEQRIAQEYAVAFGGGGGNKGWVSQQPDKWEHDTMSHGTLMSAVVLGFSFFSTPINGVAPLATVIPVKVLNTDHSGWWSVVARGIVYVADLKAGPLAEHPIVINLSLVGPSEDAMLRAAIDYAISRGVIVVAAAGNYGEGGMGYPAAYPEVISAAASGYIGQGVPDWNWYWQMNVPDPTDPNDFFIADYSSRALPGQDLDVAAPGHWVAGPYQLNMGQIRCHILWGTSLASPHVAGIVALMAQKCPALTASQAEAFSRRRRSLCLRVAAQSKSTLALRHNTVGVPMAPARAWRRRTRRWP